MLKINLTPFQGRDLITATTRHRPKPCDVNCLPVDDTLGLKLIKRQTELLEFLKGEKVGALLIDLVDGGVLNGVVGPVAVANGKREKAPKRPLPPCGPRHPLPAR
ncbi:hypothetical protein LZK75_24170 [Rhizobium leguminosarum]|nr:hypothetical protein LZK75_24170 [Rhizobium leguminosarum]